MKTLPEGVIVACQLAAIAIVYAVLWLYGHRHQRALLLDYPRRWFGWRRILFTPYPPHRLTVRQLLRRITCEHAKCVASDYLRDLHEIADREMIEVGYECPRCYTLVKIAPRPPEHPNCRCTLPPELDLGEYPFHHPGEPVSTTFILAAVSSEGIPPSEIIRRWG